MKRIAFYLGLAAALVASCSVKEEDFVSSQKDDVIFYASFEQPTKEDTRVYVNEDLLLRWNADDRVSIFNRNTYNQQYRFTGETGDNAGGFKKVDSDEFVTGNALANVVSIYPYQEATKITEAGTLTLILPSEQHYAENTFGLGANTMVSVTEDNFLQYKNVGGFLRLRLYGEGVSVSSITLKGNNGEKLAGKASVTMPLNDTPAVTMADDATDAITLVCDTPITLNATAEESVDFWFVVPPVTFSKGFTVSVNHTTGGVFEKSTAKSITIGRNNLSKMSPIEVEGYTPTAPVPEAIDLGLPSGLKWASFNLGASKPEEYGEYYACGETEPHYESGYAQSDFPVWKTGKEAGYDWSSYKLCMGSYDTLTKYCRDSSDGYKGFTDNKTILDLEDDAAHVNLGGNWRMPTYDEMTELYSHCTWTWTTQNGVNGDLVTGPNGNSIFLPAAGHRETTSLYSVGSAGIYWSSCLNTVISYDAEQIDFSSRKIQFVGGFRCWGLSVRPVYGEFQSVESVSLNKTSLSLLEVSFEVLAVTILPSDATEKNVTWTSSDTSVATVRDGVVTAVSAGTATITAWASDGVHYATCNVTVTDREPTIVTPEAIDLGLPSGLKWASFNLGATSQQENGDYYAWGEIEPKSDYNWSTYKWCMGSSTTMTKYCQNADYGYEGFTDEKTVLDPEDDPAHVNLGGSWRMPTDAEMTELMENCTWEWTIQNGITGRLVTGPNGKSLFFSAAGYRFNTVLYDAGFSCYYWSSSLNTDIPYNGRGVGFSSTKVFRFNDYRYYGFPIRPVYGDSSIIPVKSVNLDKIELDLAVGGEATLNAIVLPENATNKTVSWSSSNESVATVSSSGVVTGVAPGSATITTTTVDGGKTATCTVTVTAPYTVATPEAVDLGLSVKWASFNVGASKPEEYGDYFAWGETEPYYISQNPLIWETGKEGGYTYTSYKLCMGSYDTLTKYCADSSHGYNGFRDHKTVLDPEDDAAHVNLGGKWRMPTASEVDELISTRNNPSYQWEWRSPNGYYSYGWLVTYLKNNNSIFFPFSGRWYLKGLEGRGGTGYYWSSSLFTDEPTGAWSMVFSSDGGHLGNVGGRVLGQSVRPVYGEFKSVESVYLNKTSLTLLDGSTEKLTVTILPSDATEKTVTWASSRSSVARVSSNGKVTAVSAGTATITAWASDGVHYATCNVTVREPAPTPKAVDLGLPSGLKWASFNLGASRPEEYGDYYAWGETEPYYSSQDPLTWNKGKENGYSWSSYKWCMGSNNTMAKYCTDSSYGYDGFTDGKTILDPEDDAAHVNLGGSWRMPTDAEWTELIDNCTWTWTTQIGVKGMLVTARNGNSIFLPAAGDMYYTDFYDVGSDGDYSSSSLYSGRPTNTWFAAIASGGVLMYNSDRCFGQSVRPVTE